MITVRNTINTLKTPKYSHDYNTNETSTLHDRATVSSCKKSCTKDYESFLSCFALTFNYLPPFSLSCNDDKSPFLFSNALHDNAKIDAPKNAIIGQKRPASSLRPYILGIDPGITGACALINVDGQVPELVKVWDMPTCTIKSKTRLDILALAFQIDAYAPMVKVALIEEVGFMKGKEARGSAFTFGFATGAVHGVLHTCLIPTQTVKPSVWKLELGLSSDKAESIARAIKVIPESSEFLTRKKDHGRAEAILLAWYAWRKLNVAH